MQLDFYNLNSGDRLFAALEQGSKKGRDALPLDPRQHVRWSCPLCRLG
jgi:hypothetical protein